MYAPAWEHLPSVGGRGAVEARRAGRAAGLGRGCVPAVDVGGVGSQVCVGRLVASLHASNSGSRQAGGVDQVAKTKMRAARGSLASTLFQRSSAASLTRQVSQTEEPVTVAH